MWDKIKNVHSKKDKDAIAIILQAVMEGCESLHQGVRAVGEGPPVG